MSDKIFIDTNIWIYVYALAPPDRHERAQELIHNEFERIMISSQVLGELYHVMTRKGFQTLETAKETVNEISAAFSVLEIGVEHVLKAIDINHKYRFRIGTAWLSPQHSFMIAGASTQKTCNTIN